MDESVRALLEPAWPEVQRPPSGASEAGHGTSWNWVLSAPFPLQWPPRAGLYLRYYAYAYGFDPYNGLVDAVRVAAPWATVEAAATGNGSPRLVQLAEALEEIGIQGVRALTEVEAAVYQREEAIVRCLATLRGLPGETAECYALLKDYYRLWLRHHRVVAGGIRPLHAPFLAWLEAYGGRPGGP
jgi:hypothetical protein